MVDMDNISYWVFPGIAGTHVRVPDLDYILARSAECFGVSADDIVSRTRRFDITLARHAYCFAASSYTNETLLSIAGKISRHHASVINSIKASRNMIETNFVDFKKRYEYLIKLI
jgi:chromosomal replication initiation ATPase DnaA